MSNVALDMNSKPAAVPDHVPIERIMDIDLYNLDGAEADFHKAWSDVREAAAGRVIWTPRNGGHWIVTAGADIHEVLGDYTHFASGLNVLPESRGKDMRTLPTSINPPEHAPYRALLNPGLSPKSVLRMGQVIRQVAVDTIDRFIGRGHCEFIAEYSTVLPIMVFMKLVDLPEEDVPHLKYLTDQVTRPDGSMTMAEVTQGFIDYLLPYVRARRGGSGNDMLTAIVNGQIHGELIGEEAALAMCSQLLLGGLDTVASFLGFAFLYLAKHPEKRRELIAHPEKISAAADEFLRRFPVVTLTRTVAEDVQWKGVQLRKGDHLCVPTPVHGVDPSAFSDPFEIDFDRPPQAHSTFGNGPHRCPGAFLARFEMRITLEEWLSRIPDFSLDEEPVRMMEGVVGTIDKLMLHWPVAARH